MHLELARTIGSALLGVCLGIVGSIYGKAEPGWIAVIVVGFLATLSAFALIYFARTSRREFLDGYQPCPGVCRGEVQRRRMWRIPESNVQMSGLAVCRRCFVHELGHGPNPFRDKLAYANKGEEYENTRAGKAERKEWERNRRSMIEAIRTPVTEEELRLELHGPDGEEIPIVRKAMDELRVQKDATLSDSQSPQPPKRDP